ncbi:DUF503 domain-containing protein [Anaerotalea alkaliphila]|uniref:DUF503 domain-containing protein n=1 Tax=Anaerotalea alkaliphila TaxID=2662126 RepID=A0A7X5HXR3_9FIRM|nr:DUF503 domain-containing protein [Anaerotalea alkaliphila]NDL68456.1 DUF503 domain-containing protein [Anaerotalea alkaliphila]
MMLPTVTLKLYAPWVHSLKEKRSLAKSLLAKIQNRLPVAAAEIEAQDIHQTLVLGIVGIALERGQADRLMDQVIRFVEENTEAQLLEVEREIR